MINQHPPYSSHPTQHGGVAIVQYALGDALYFTASGTPMEDIDGILHDLEGAGHGREFIRADGRTVTISVSGKVV